MAFGATQTPQAGLHRWLDLGLAVVVCTSCAAQAEPPAVALPALDRATFDLDTGPLLAARCGDALCHGRADRPFVLYSVGRHRLDPAQTLRSVPLSTQERERNYLSTLGFIDHAEPQRTTLLRKALGRLGHKGGVVFEAPSDPPMVAIAQWLTGDVARRRVP